MGMFEEAYEALNTEQRRAVDITEGPVMVVAGPGTGKTQLLAVRVANILHKNSTILPTNILCLTFTEAGQAAMQKRLVQIMGDTGAHVAVHTFHSFGAEIINRYPHFFYEGLTYQPADPLISHEILLKIFESLPHDNLLASQNKGDFVYLGSAKKLLSQLKKAAISPGELKKYAISGIKFVDYIEEHLVDLFDVPSFSSASDITRAEKLQSFAISFSDQNPMISNAISLATVFNETFGAALEAAQLSGKTKPLNEWKKDWYKKDKTGSAVCKQREVHEKLLAFVDIYKQYSDMLDDRRLFDFDDMILRVVHAVETNLELAYEIQEQYQYFLVDEFQDTNAGQLRLLTALASHPVNEGRPNVMVVGDDDQAIFAFQGAELSNILRFESSYRDVVSIVLRENYRSQSEILQTSRSIITQGSQRLESSLAISKELFPMAKRKDIRLERRWFTTQAEELFWVATEIRKLLNKGVSAKEIAVICREHKHLESLLPYLARTEIPVWYERQQDALREPVIVQILLLARVVNYLAADEQDAAEELLPELLAAPYWGLSSKSLWQIGIRSKRSYSESGVHKSWLEVLAEAPDGSKESLISNLLFSAAKLARTEPLETVLDVLIGNVPIEVIDDSQDDFSKLSKKHFHQKSPLKEYYFSIKRLHQNPRIYNDALTALVALRNRVRQFVVDQDASLSELIRYVDLAQSAGVKITSKPILGSAESSVQLVTAHGSKGLEYETVFVLSTTGDVWDKTPRGDKLALPPNMLHISHPTQTDDNLRVLFVAMTRAKSQLILTQHEFVEVGGKAAKLLAPLEHPSLSDLKPDGEVITPVIKDIPDETILLETSWHDKYIGLDKSTLEELMASTLSDYRLSVTHLHNFLDVTKGGPHYFLLVNLLRFPSAMSPSGAYGDVMHKVLQDIHTSVLQNGRTPKQDKAMALLERLLVRKQMSKSDLKNYLARGAKAIEAFYRERSMSLRPEQKPEQDFYAQNVFVGSARLSGKLDLLEVTKSGVVVTDYKTGKPLGDWSESKKSAYEKIKQHHYRQQLFFYKLLIDGSRDYGDNGHQAFKGELVFIEPNKEGIQSLELDITDENEIKRLKNLIAVVWRHIQELNFPDVSKYTQDIAGIREFEQDLLDGKI